MDVFGFDLSPEEIDLITSFDCNGCLVVVMANGMPRDDLNFEQILQTTKLNRLIQCTFTALKFKYFE